MNADDEELVKLHNDSLPVSVNLYQSKYTTARICKKVMENKDIKTDQKRCKVLKLLGHELDIKEIQYQAKLDSYIEAISKPDETEDGFTENERIINYLKNNLKFKELNNEELDVYNAFGQDINSDKLFYYVCCENILFFENMPFYK